MKVELEAEEIYVFNSFDEWVNKASSRLGGFGKQEKIICLDVNGNACNIGQDFQSAKAWQLFPVKAYRLIRTYEAVPF